MQVRGHAFPSIGEPELPSRNGKMGRQTEGGERTELTSPGSDEQRMFPSGWGGVGLGGAGLIGKEQVRENSLRAKQRNFILKRRVSSVVPH